MSRSKPLHPPVASCAVWLRVTYTVPVDAAARRRLAARLDEYLARSGIKPITAPRMIGLHSVSGVSPVDVARIVDWLSAQPEVYRLQHLESASPATRPGVRRE